ncbi:hypothetical protein BJX76DRAFT_37239 [Aspergillus varians]
MTDAIKPPCHVTGTALITGGASGIGKSMAHSFAQNGITGLALADVSPANLANALTELTSAYPHVRVETFSVDVTKEEQVAALVKSVAESFGRIDISIHGAGISSAPSPTHELALADWQRVIDINQTGVMLCDKWVVKQMLTQELIPGYQGRGMIVNVSSMYGLMAPGPSMPVAAYTAAKHAVIALTKLDGKTYAKDGIRINAFCPGYVDTPLVHEGIVSGALTTELGKAAIGRPATAEEIADAVLFLTSRMGSYMCANVLVVDGGSTSF